MQIRNFVWSRKIIEKVIQKHNVDPEDVEEVFDGSHLVYRVEKSKYKALGKSYAGRYLAVFFIDLGEGNAKPIRARDMNSSERKLLRKKRRANK